MKYAAGGIIKNARADEKKNAAASPHLFCKKSPKPGIMTEAAMSIAMLAYFFIR